MKAKTATKAILATLFALAVLTLTAMCVLGVDAHNEDGTLDLTVATLFGVAGTIILVLGGWVEDYVAE